MPKLAGQSHGDAGAASDQPMLSGKRAERQQVGIGDRVGDDKPLAITLGKAQRGLGRSRSQCLQRKMADLEPASAATASA